MTAKARSRSRVMVLSSPGGSASNRSSAPILTSSHLGETRHPESPEIAAKPLGGSSSQIGERASPSDGGRSHRRAHGQQRNAFAGMVGRGSSGVVAVVGGDEQQIVLS